MDKEKPEQVYEVLGRRVTKEQYDDSKKRMDSIADELPEDLLEFGKAARQRAKQKQPEVIKKAKGGSVKSSASKRADGCAIRGKTRGRMV